MFRKLSVLIVALCGLLIAGCDASNSKCVQPGRLGRINKPEGWSPEILKPGYHTCYGRDQLYTVQVSNETFKEHMEILIGGKCNLTVDFMVRVHLNAEAGDEPIKKVFENTPATLQEGTYNISVAVLYETYLKMKAQAIPMEVFQVQPDIATACANSGTLGMEIRKKMIEAAKATPLAIEDCQIVNYDWPKSLTQAQEDLVKIQLKEAAAEAEARAKLKATEAELKIAEAKMLVELKEAEGIAGGIAIIKKALADAPEYLVWHQIKMMKEAANGPNNCFILYPYTTDAGQVKQLLNNANLVQMLHPEGPHPEAKKASAQAEKTPATAEKPQAPAKKD